MPLTIGQVAQQAGVGVETVRFYHRRGLLAEPPRRRQGFRDYPPDSIARLRFIRRAQQLGFSLQQIGELLELHHDSANACGTVRAQAHEKLTGIEAKIRDLKAVHRALARLIRACDENQPLARCPILKALGDEDSQ